MQSDNWFLLQAKITNQFRDRHSKKAWDSLLCWFCSCRWCTAVISRKSIPFLKCLRSLTRWNYASHRWRHSNCRYSWNCCWSRSNLNLGKCICMSQRAKNWSAWMDRRFGCSMICLKNVHTKTIIKTEATQIN